MRNGIKDQEVNQGEDIINEKMSLNNDLTIGLKGQTLEFRDLYSRPHKMIELHSGLK